MIILTFNVCFYLFIFLSGEITEEELLNRLHQIRDGPEQPHSSSSNNPEVSMGEPRGMIGCLSSDSNTNS